MPLVLDRYYGTAPQTWTPPIGIPSPSFGITEVAPALPDPWTGPVANFYYVDYESGDDANTPGYPGAARQTIPKTLATAGTPIVVVIGGSTYAQNQTSPNQLHWTGTASAPIYLRGVSAASPGALDMTCELESTYAILEYLRWTQTGTAKQAVQLYTLSQATDHVVLRHCEIQGNETGVNPTAAVGMACYSATLAPHDLVIWDCHVHHFGDPAAEGDPDFHGISVANGTGGAGVHHVWVVDCELDHNQGDGLQLTNALLEDQAKMHHYYVGRCESHENRQSGIWSKSTVDTIFSQNRCWGHRPSASSGGAGLGAQYGPERLWMLFNHSYNNEGGIAFGSDSGLGAGTETYVLGNLVEGCGPVTPTYDASDPYLQVGALNSYQTTATRYLVNNTFWNNTRGFTTTTTGGVWHLVNNILGPPTYGDDYTVCYVDATVAANAEMHHNLVPATERISWAHTVETLAAFQTRTGKGTDCSTAAPGFVDASGGQFQLTGDSAAVNAGTLHAAYATFATTYGLSIAQDRDGVERPQGGVYDLGAYERVA